MPRRDRHDYAGLFHTGSSVHCPTLKFVVAQFQRQVHRCIFSRHARITYPGRASMKDATRPWTTCGNVRIALPTVKRARGRVVERVRGCGLRQRIGCLALVLPTEPGLPITRTLRSQQRTSTTFEWYSLVLLSKLRTRRTDWPTITRSRGLRSRNERISYSLRFFNTLPFAHRGR